MFRAPLCPSSGTQGVSGRKTVTAFGPDIHPSCLHFLQPAATREPDGLCGNQRYRSELLIIGIMVHETC